MKFTQFFSYIMHPILIPLIIFCIIFRGVEDFYFLLRSNLVSILSIIVLFTIIFPVIHILLLKKFKFISNLELNIRDERNNPLFSTFVYYYIGYYLLKEYFYYVPIIEKVFLGGILLVIISLIINYFWKISLHMIGVGTASGTFIVLHQIYSGLFYFILVFFLFSSLLAFARYSLKSHNFLQIYSGFFLAVIFQIFFLYW